MTLRFKPSRSRALAWPRFQRNPTRFRAHKHAHEAVIANGRWYGADPPRAFEEQAAELTERLTDVLKGGVSGRPRVVRFAIGNGPVRMVLWRMLARTSRLQGYFPAETAVLPAYGLPPPPHGMRRAGGKLDQAQAHACASERLQKARLERLYRQ